MKIAIVGSRSFTNTAMIRAVVRALPDRVTVVSGGAPGTDKIAVQEAIRRGLSTIVYPAQWNQYGKRAGYLRNKLIVEESDRVIAFWDGQSKGTRHTCDLATKAGKLWLVIEENGCQSDPEPELCLSPEQVLVHVERMSSPVAGTQ